MNIFDFALQMELDGEKFYNELAERTQCAALKAVLEGLSKDEQRHYEIIQQAQKQIFKYIEADPSLSNIQNVFAAPLTKEFVAKVKDQQTEAYRAALVKENESVALYKKLKENAATQEEKVICEKLMHEEEKHIEVLENIIDMLNHVNDWVDAPEFNLQETY